MRIWFWSNLYFVMVYSWWILKSMIYNIKVKPLFSCFCNQIQHGILQLVNVRRWLIWWAKKLAAQLKMTQRRQIHSAVGEARNDRNHQNPGIQQDWSASLAWYDRSTGRNLGDFQGCQASIGCWMLMRGKKRNIPPCLPWLCPEDVMELYSHSISTHTHTPAGQHERKAG